MSRTTIKPSSPTPPHLRHYRLSYLDQIAPACFIPLIFFNSKSTTSVDGPVDLTMISTHIKKSLSETLTRFYPLTGRLVNSLYVDCSDAGVPYTETWARCLVSELIADPIPSELIKLLPCGLRDIPLAIQVNFFDCGGVAVSLAVSHEVVDFSSLSTFVNSWALLPAGGIDCDVLWPRLDAASLFPPTDTSGYTRATAETIKDRVVTKSKIPTGLCSLLPKSLASNTNAMTIQVKEAPPALKPSLLSCGLDSWQPSIQKRTPTKFTRSLVHAINFRPRADPPLPSQCFGNISGFTIAIPSITDGEFECCEIAKQVQQGISKVDGVYVRMLSDSDKHLNFLKEAKEKVIKGKVVSFCFTSFCKFPLYEVDFGWGKPAWVNSPFMPLQNLVVFSDVKSGDGIEAWVTLKAEDMAKLEVDEDFLDFVHPKEGC